MKAFLKLIDSFLNLFRPKPRNKTPGGPRLGLVATETSDNGVNTSRLVPDLGPTTAQTILNSHKEFSLLIDPVAHNAFIATPKKKRHKTKKAAAQANTADILEILKWTTLLTATQLQKSSRVRRDRFLPLLKKLVKQGKIERTGSGKRGNPYFYKLNRGKL